MRGDPLAVLVHQTPATDQETPRPVRRAVILAAGKGNRLQPLTADIPKCLAEIGGEALLERALRALASQGVCEATVVVGYKGEAVRERIGGTFADVAVSYIDAPDYETTNNIRSVWDAREALDQDVLLLDADIVFDPDVIAGLLTELGSSAAVATFNGSQHGTVVRRDENGHVSSFILAADQDGDFDAEGTFKTVNIYLLREELLRTQVLPRLEREIVAGRVHQYYEAVLRDCVADGSMTDLAAVDVSDSRWYESDDARDLDAAEFRFLDRDAQFDRIQQLHGSYWRYGFTDHSYLYNMHFPPEEMLEGFKGSLREIVTNYPVAQSELARLVADWTGGNPDEIVVANGAAELISILGTKTGRGLTIPTPSFNEYEQVVDRDRLNRFPLDPTTFELNVTEFVASATGSGSDIAVVVTPNNPTSVSVPRADVLEIAERLQPYDCRLVVDESFVDFSPAGTDASIEGMVHRHPNLVVIKSMSKVFGIAGLRIGYLASADRQFVQTIRRCLPIWNINGFAEEFLRNVVRHRSAFLESCNLTRAAYQMLHRELAALPGVEPIRPHANFVLCRLPESAGTAPEVARRMYVEHNILMKDCSKKSMPAADRFLRIASRTIEDNRRLVAALGRVLVA